MTPLPSLLFTAMKTLWGGKHHHQAELEDLRREQAAQQSSRRRGILEVAKEPSLRWQMYMLVLSGVTLQLSGIQAVELGRPLASPGRAHTRQGKLESRAMGFPPLGSAVPCLQPVPSSLGHFPHPSPRSHLGSLGS